MAEYRDDKYRVTDKDRGKRPSNARLAADLSDLASKGKQLLGEGMAFFDELRVAAGHALDAASDALDEHLEGLRKDRGTEEQPPEDAKPATEGLRGHSYKAVLGDDGICTVYFAREVTLDEFLALGAHLRDHDVVKSTGDVDRDPKSIRVYIKARNDKYKDTWLKGHIHDIVVSVTHCEYRDEPFANEA